MHGDAVRGFRGRYRIAWKGADGLFALPVGRITGGMAWLAAILYTFQIYYDFSGYSDMAIGLAGVFGFSFDENFRYPYLSDSVTVPTA